MPFCFCMFGGRGGGFFFKLKTGGDNIHVFPYFPSLPGKISRINMCENDLRPSLYAHVSSRQGEAARGGAAIIPSTLQKRHFMVKA